ncbi:1-deoxy-D-xylulose-5-phosphate reductoisomerase [Campylobacter mucosalis]|uniref:1-deoxy-D-xylulose-5-phosphate reductoisomerase n=1 Tax=Campylobacter mucosalis TaxID=202 RepID=UPI001EEE34C0|nr:1-deoxy-D-xylulose-5-phosphate reductoisomerase [Campylobacter mucosalis]
MDTIVVILGSTGSIGTNALEICKQHNIQVEALSCGSNVDLLNEQILKFNPKFVCISDPALKSKVLHKWVFVGDEISDMLELCKSQKVVNAIVGFAGLRASLKTQKLGKTLALANKESLVVGGKFLKTDEILPIDSEHFGLKFLLQNKTKISKLIITASGGAFYKTPKEALKNVTPKEALKHPNWSMGAKITIDSASMANKLFEIMEAYWLYGTKNIDAIIEPTSMIHALIEFIDGSTTAHFSRADMKLAIAHAVLENVDENVVKPLDLLELSQIKFHQIDTEKYPIFSLKDELLNSPDMGVVVNAANEVMVAKFLKNECGFLDISNATLKAFNKFSSIKISSSDEIFEIDKEVRKYTKEIDAKI